MKLGFIGAGFIARFHAIAIHQDRKSTRLNSSHANNLVCRLLLEKKNYRKPLTPPVSRQIVGVVADVIAPVVQRENVSPIYVPFGQDTITTMRLVIRVDGDPTAL